MLRGALVPALLLALCAASDPFPCDSGSAADVCVVSAAHSWAGAAELAALVVAPAGSVTCEAAGCALSLTAASVNVTGALRSQGALSVAAADWLGVSGSVAAAQGDVTLASGGVLEILAGGEADAGAAALTLAAPALELEGAARGAAVNVSGERVLVGGSVSADGRSALAWNGASASAGGGHGGAGGAATDGSGSAGGAAFDDPDEPSRPGAAGAAAGGGVVWVFASVQGALAPSASLSANGASPAAAGCNCSAGAAAQGGGAGGTVRVEGASLEGSGAVEAAGGDGCCGGGGGGGGRVAMRLAQVRSITAQPSAPGGSGGGGGEDGSAGSAVLLQTDLCSTRDCFHGGTCVPATGECECPAGFSGVSCWDVEVDNCQYVECAAGRECDPETAACVRVPSDDDDFGIVVVSSADVGHSDSHTLTTVLAAVIAGLVFAGAVAVVRWLMRRGGESGGGGGGGGGGAGEEDELDGDDEELSKEIELSLLATPADEGEWACSFCGARNAADTDACQACAGAPTAAQRAQLDEARRRGGAPEPLAVLEAEAVAAATGEWAADTKLCDGSLGPVHRAAALLEPPRACVVKRLDACAPAARGEVFAHHARAQAALRHRHLQPLLGFAAPEDGPPALVVAEAPGGTLAAALPALSWQRRLDAAIHVAHALAFLHTRPGRPVVHRGVSADRVLLWGAEARLTLPSLAADLGARVLPEDVSPRRAEYAPPEGAARPTPKTDVYAVGVLLLELLTGQPAHDEERSPASLVQRLRRRDVAALADERAGQWPLPVIKVLELLARQCLAADRAARPTTPDVLAQLEKLRRDVG